MQLRPLFLLLIASTMASLPLFAQNSDDRDFGSGNSYIESTRAPNHAGLKIVGAVAAAAIVAFIIINSRGGSGHVDATTP